MAVVFISYRHEDTIQAEKLAEAIREAGHEVLIDRRSIKPGENIHAKIGRDIDRANFFLACLSSAGHSPWTEDELGAASMRHESCLVIPVRLTGGEPTGLLRARSCVDLLADWQHGIDELLALFGPPNADAKSSAWSRLARQQSKNSLVLSVESVPALSALLESMTRSYPAAVARDELDVWSSADREAMLLHALDDACRHCDVELTAHEATLAIGAILVARALGARALPMDEKDDDPVWSSEHAAILQLAQSADPEIAGATQARLRHARALRRKKFWCAADLEPLLPTPPSPLFRPEVVAVLARASVATIDEVRTLKSSRKERENGASFELRDRVLALLLSLAERTAIEPGQLPENILHQLGARFGLSTAQLANDVAGAEVIWSERETKTLIIKAQCAHPAVDQALTDVAGELDRYLRGSAPEFANELALPTSCRAEVEPRRIGNKPCYEKPLVTFTMEPNDVRELLIGTELWSEPGLAYRELYQNALDACRYRECRAKYQTIKYIPQIRFYEGVAEDGRKYVDCEDNGVGMNLELVRNCFARAGRRFATTTDFLREQAAWRSAGIGMTPNSQFGIGVFSYFMVAEELEIETSRHDPQNDAPGERFLISIATASSLFRVTRLDPEEARKRLLARQKSRGEELDGKPNAGTCIRLYLRPGKMMRCIDALEGLVWFTDVSLVVSTYDDRRTEWTPSTLSPKLEGYAVGPANERRLWWVVDPGKRPKTFQMLAGSAGSPATRPLRRVFREAVMDAVHGAVLVDGIATSLAIPCVVLNFEREEQMRLSLDRRTLRDGFPLALADRTVEAALPSLPEKNRRSESWWRDFASSWPRQARRSWVPESTDVLHAVRGLSETAKFLGQAWLGSAQNVSPYLDKTIVDAWRARPISPVKLSALALQYRAGNYFTLPDLLAIEAWTGVDRAECAREVAELSAVLGWKTPRYTPEELDAVGLLTESDEALLAGLNQDRRNSGLMGAILGRHDDLTRLRRLRVLSGSTWSGDVDAMCTLLEHHPELARAARRQYPVAPILALQTALVASQTFTELAEHGRLLLRAFIGSDVAWNVAGLGDLSALDRRLIEAATSYPVPHVAGDRLIAMIREDPQAKNAIIDRAKQLGRAFDWRTFELQPDACDEEMLEFWSIALASYQGPGEAELTLTQALAIWDRYDLDLGLGAEFFANLARIFGFGYREWPHLALTQSPVRKAKDRSLLRNAIALEKHGLRLTALLTFHQRGELSRFNEIAVAFGLPALPEPPELDRCDQIDFKLLSLDLSEGAWIGRETPVAHAIAAVIELQAPAWVIHERFKYLSTFLEVEPPSDDANYLGISWKELVDRSRIEHAAYGQTDSDEDARKLNAALAETIRENDARICGQFAIVHPSLRNALDLALESVEPIIFDSLVTRACETFDAKNLASASAIETLFLAAARRMDRDPAQRPSSAHALWSALEKCWQTRPGAIPYPHTRQLEEQPSSRRRWWAACWTWSFEVVPPEQPIAVELAILFPGWSKITLQKATTASFPRPPWRDEVPDVLDGYSTLVARAKNFVERCSDEQPPERVQELLLPAVIAASEQRSWKLGPAILELFRTAHGLDQELAEVVDNLSPTARVALARDTYLQAAPEHALWAFSRWQDYCPETYSRLAPLIEMDDVATALKSTRQPIRREISRVPLHLVVPLVLLAVDRDRATFEPELALAVAEIQDAETRSNALEALAPHSQQARYQLWARAPARAMELALNAYAAADPLAREWIWQAPKEHREALLIRLSDATRGEEWLDRWLAEIVREGGPLAQRAHALQMKLRNPPTA